MKLSTRHGLPVTFSGVLAWWVLRILVELEGHRFTMDARTVTEPWVFSLIGPEDFIGGPEMTRERRMALLREKLQAMDIVQPRLPKSATLSKNIAWIQKSLGLGEVERDIVAFLALTHYSSDLECLLDRFGGLHAHEVHRMLAVILGATQEEVSAALGHGSRLVSSGLVWMEARGRWAWSLKIGLLSGIGELLATDHADPAALFASNFVRFEATSLKVEDFPHLQTDLDILLPYLKRAVVEGTPGVHILLHGEPGTGKTELTRALADHLGLDLYEVAVQDRNGIPLKGEARLGAFQLAQGVLAGRRDRLLLFDEVEDVFRLTDEEAFGTGRGNRSGKKGFINRLLTQGSVPTVWVTNACASIDRAYLRRFDLVLEVPVPPRSVREEIVRSRTHRLSLPPGCYGRLAQHGGVTPAAIDKAARVTEAVLTVDAKAAPDAILSRILDNALGVMGRDKLQVGQADEVPYRPDLLAADRDLAQIAHGLKGQGGGRLCLHGPPGTGKTAWGRHLAHVLDRPLHVHRGSDLLGPYVGETEQRMAKMFRQAQRDHAVLLLDEVDSFLRDRSGTDLRGWEISQVNEMLTGIEGFEGVFVASTNALERLDPAVLRRFDLKIRFGFLTPAQAAQMLAEYVKLLGLAMTTPATRAVKALTQLTPGDFATVARQARMDPIRSGVEFVRRLAAEVALKGQPARRPLGFGGVHGGI